MRLTRKIRTYSSKNYATGIHRAGSHSCLLNVPLNATQLNRSKRPGNENMYQDKCNVYAELLPVCPHSRVIYHLVRKLSHFIPPHIQTINIQPLSVLISKFRNKNQVLFVRWLVAFQFCSMRFMMSHSDIEHPFIFPNACSVIQIIRLPCLISNTNIMKMNSE